MMKVKNDLQVKINSIKEYLKDFDYMNMKESVNGFVQLLKKLNIKMVVFDFDLTMISAHSGGYIDVVRDENNIGTAITNDFKLFSKSLCANDIKITVATFSDDETVKHIRGNNLIAGEKMVNYCLKKSNCDINIEKVYAYYPYYYREAEKYKKLGLNKPMTNDKSYHLERIRMDFFVNNEEILFIDDDLNNCISAKREGYITFNVKGSDGFNFKKIMVM